MPGIGWLMIAVPPIYFVLPRNPIGDDVVLINWIGALWQENFEEEGYEEEGERCLDSSGVQRSKITGFQEGNGK
jgi:hypothetical protein